MKRFRTFVLALVCALSLFPSRVGAKGYFYEVLQAPSGFPGSIRNVFSVPGGYIWAGTEDGLIRLDYYNYKLYKADGTERSIPGNFIESACVDLDGRFWIATDKGPAVYNEEVDSFEPLFLDVDGTGEPVITHTWIEASGFVLVGGDNRLYRFDRESGKLTVLKEISDDDSFIVDHIFRAGNDYLLIDSEKGCLHYSAKTNEIRRSSLDITDNYCVFMDSRDRIWRSVFNEGLECYDTDGRLRARYNTSNSDLSCDVVTSIIERKGEIWAATISGGINIINPEDGSIRVLRGDADNPNTFPANSVVSLMCDHNDYVWAALSKGGVVVIRELYNKSFAVSPTISQNGLASQSIRCFSSEGGDDLLWMGTETQGLYSYNNRTDEIRSYPSTGGLSVQSLAALPGGRLLLYCYARGLFVFDKKSAKLTPFQSHVPELDDYLIHNRNIVYLNTDATGNVLIAAGETVYVYDPETGSIGRSPIGQRTPGDIFIKVLGGREDFFHSSRFVWRWNSSVKALELVFDMEREIINSATVDQSGCFWIATKEGFGKLDPVTGEFEPVETNLVNSAQSISCDFKGRIWIGASGMLSVYLPSNSNFVFLNVGDGVYNNVYSRTARFFGDDGTLSLGGSNGFVRADLSVTFEAKSLPQIRLMDATVDNVRISKYLHNLIPAGYGGLRVRVFSAEDDILRNKMFRFRVLGPRGADYLLVESAPETVLRYKNPGKYVVFASCTMNNGEWTDWTEVLTFRVKAVWYRSLWFFLLCFIGLLTVLLLVIIGRNRKVSEQERHKADTDRIRFLLNVSHELKTPLTLIIGPLDRILKETPQTDANYPKLLGALRQALRMRTLILTVLDAHKIEENAATLHAESQDYNGWVNDIAQSFKEEMSGRGIQLQTKFDARIGNVDIDSQKLENVLTNLLINALKHSPNDTSVVVGTEYMPERKMIRTYVSDHGQGLGGVDATKLFSRYYQGVTEKTGSGMGLAYANTIVQLHNGEMGACDNAHGGATFYFDIPWSVVAREDVKPIHKFEAADISEASLLVVDDDFDLRSYLSEEMSAIAGAVFEAEDGADAVEVLKREKIDIVVSDVRMPNMDGFQLCEFIKSSPQFAHIPVVLLTTRADAENRDKGLQIGADEYVTKPFEIPALADTINNLIHRQ